MPTKETGKERASRIPLDYFKKADTLQRLKLVLAGVALLSALSWVGAMQLRHDDQPYSRGPVSAVHATWDAQCEACHQSFAPLGGDNVAHLFSSNPHQGDLLCTTCHAGPAHHADQLPERTPTCAACHREHQGRNMLLTRNADQECTACHRELSRSRTANGAGKEFKDSITSFTGDHPEFRSIQDPRKLKFNHKLHLTQGLVRDPKAVPWKFANLEGAEEQTRYMEMLGGTDKDAAVQLTCVACHQADASSFAASGTPTAPRAAGAYMQPIKFENHCQACHPLTVPGPDNKEIHVPHHLQPDEVRDYLWGALAKDESRKRDEQLREPARPLPGAPLPAESTVRRQILDKTEEGMRFLEKERVEGVGKWLFRGKSTCGECHEYDRRGDVNFRITPTNIPVVWLQHARFDHTAHRAIDCLDCHKETLNSPKLGQVLSGTANSQEMANRLLLPDIKTCQECHGPSRGIGKAALGGARSDCVECHRYHNGDSPLQGIGALLRGPKHKFTTPAQFHSGAPPP